MELNPIQRLAAGLLFLVLSVVIFGLVVILCVMVEVLDEGLMHSMTAFESEPSEGWAYWRNKAIREALPSWIICGSIWLVLTGILSRWAWKLGNAALVGSFNKSVFSVLWDLLKKIPIRIYFDGEKRG